MYCNGVQKGNNWNCSKTNQKILDLNGQQGNLIQKIAMAHGIVQHKSGLREWKSVKVRWYLNLFLVSFFDSLSIPQSYYLNLPGLITLSHTAQPSLSNDTQLISHKYPPLRLQQPWGWLINPIILSRDIHLPLLLSSCATYSLCMYFSYYDLKFSSS